MTIKRSDTVFIPSTTTKERPQYCPVCERHGIRHLLKKRVYNDLELIFGQLPSDHERWLQCYHCGNQFLKDRVRQEGKLTTDIQIAKPSPVQTEHWEKPKHRRGFNERLSKGEDEIKDKDLKRELKKGAKLINYQES